MFPAHQHHNSLHTLSDPFKSLMIYSTKYRFAGATTSTFSREAFLSMAWWVIYRLPQQIGALSRELRLFETRLRCLRFPFTISAPDTLSLSSRVERIFQNFSADIENVILRAHWEWGSSREIYRILTNNIALNEQFSQWHRHCTRYVWESVKRWKIQFSLPKIFFSAQHWHFEHYEFGFISVNHKSMIYFHFTCLRMRVGKQQTHNNI